MQEGGHVGCKRGRGAGEGGKGWSIGGDIRGLTVTGGLGSEVVARKEETVREK